MYFRTKFGRSLRTNPSKAIILFGSLPTLVLGVSYHGTNRWIDGKVKIMNFEEKYRVRDAYNEMLYED